MATKPPTPIIAMQVTTLEAVDAVLSEEKAYCEHCGQELKLWPPDDVRQHVYEKHSAVFWPQHLAMYKKFLAEPPTRERSVALQNERSSYLVKILATRFDLYQKLVDAGAIVKPAAG